MSFESSRMVQIAAFRLSTGASPAEVERSLLSYAPAAAPADIARAIDLGTQAVEAGRLEHYAAISGVDTPALPPQLTGTLGGSALVVFDVGADIGYKSVRIDNIKPGETIGELQRRIAAAVEDVVRRDYRGDVAAAVESAVVRYLVPEG